MKKALCLTLAIVMLLALASCKPTVDEGIWKDAIYTEDAVVGEGAKTCSVRIEAGEKSVTLTLKTDAATLGAALYENGLAGDPSFTDTINGMVADWDADNAYWAFYISGEYAMYGIGDATINGGEEFALVYTAE